MKKFLMLLLATTIATVAYGAVQKGKTVFESIELNGVVVEKAIAGIGSIQQSILTEAQFQSQMGTEWVKMRGQSVTGSRLCNEFSICTLPSAEGRFLRDSVSDAGLRTTPNDTTAKNGLSNASSSVTVSGTANGALASFKSSTYTGNTSGGSLASFKSANYGISEGAHVHSINHDHTTVIVGSDTHYHYSGEVHTSTGGAAYGSSTRTNYLYKDGNSESTSANIIYRTSSDTHSHSVDVGAHSGNSGAASWSTGATFNTDSLDSTTYQTAHTHTTSFNPGSLDSTTYQDNHTHTVSGTGTAEAQTITGDTETAPDHIIVNTFIKIN